MNIRRKFRPAVDSLEDRLALSTAMAQVAQSGGQQAQIGDPTDSTGADVERKDGSAGADVESKDDSAGADVERHDGNAAVAQSAANTSAVHQTLAPMLLSTSAAQGSTTTVSLSGTARGVYNSLPSNPDTGTTIRGTAKGPVSPLGQASTTGSFLVPGFIRNGKEQGTLTLKNQRGSVTLNMTAPVLTGSSGLSHHFTYQIVSGTGQFRDAHGSGTVDVTLTPSRSQPGSGLPRLGNGKWSLAFASH